ncbi:MAG: hypothetical protein ABTQ29_08920 [Siculibacillus sp.]
MARRSDQTAPTIAPRATHRRRRPLPLARVALLSITALFTATVVVFAVMQLITLPRLAELAEARPFDTRFFGYDRASAVAFLKALGPGGRAEYLWIQLRLDNVFPVLYGLSLSLLLADVLGRAGLATRWAFLLAFCVVLPTAALDLAENATIAEMLRRPPDAVGVELVARASLHTTLKWASAAFGFAVAALALILAARRARKDIGS